MEMVKAENVSYEYTQMEEDENGQQVEIKKLALDKISLTINSGDFIAILGHNGSGKSTFAKHINALISPSDGALWVCGYDTSKHELIWDVRQSAGMVFQNPDNQIVATIVEEDVAFGPENLGVEPSEIRKRVDKALKAVGMSEFRKNSPSKLSGGQKQRIAIAGVLAMKPKCIILDEPTAMLDPQGRKDVMNTVMELNKEEGITVIIITHYMDEAILADKIFIIDDGRLVMEGKPKEVFTEVERLKGFGLDVPQVTEVSYNLRKMGIDIADDILTVEEMVGAICQLKSTI